MGQRPAALLLVDDLKGCGALLIAMVSFTGSLEPSPPTI
jgi:hypothetical protein